MTAQVQDLLWHRRTMWTLCGTKGTGLWSPPFEMSWRDTSCYRGYACRYAVTARRLRLVGVLLCGRIRAALPGGIDPPDVGDLILFGQKASSSHMGTAFYRVSVTIAFTGSMRIGANPIFESAGWFEAYGERRELRFRNGVLRADRNLGPGDPLRRDSGRWG